MTCNRIKRKVTRGRGGHGSSSSSSAQPTGPGPGRTLPIVFIFFISAVRRAGDVWPAPMPCQPYPYPPVPCAADRMDPTASAYFYRTRGGVGPVSTVSAAA